MSNQNDIFNRIRLAAPTSYEDAIFDVAQTYGVTELMGTGYAPFGHSCFTDSDAISVSMDVKGRHMRRAADLGLTFNYVVDAPCVGNREYDLLQKEQMLTQLKWASDQGIAAVTVGSAFLIELVAHHLPHLKVSVSQSAFVDSMEKTRQFIALGADSVTLHPDANRSVPLLRQLSGDTRCYIRLTVNSGCAFQCVYGQFHALSMGHCAAEGRGQSHGFFCDADVAGSADGLMRMRWIRPEDMGAYLDMGFSDFVIAGQGRSTAWIANAIAAWRSGRYAGNLLPLLDGGVRMSGTADAALKLQAEKLPNMLAVFENTNCRLGCDDCSRCSDLAAMAVTRTEAIP